MKKATKVSDHRGIHVIPRINADLADLFLAIILIPTDT
jgi:hypothetical protein